MWNLWLKSKTYHLLPSEVFGEEDSIAAWMLDNAVTWFGITIENALQERVKTGTGKDVEYKPRYSLTRLLDENYRIPRPLPEPEVNHNPWSPFLAWAGKPGSGVRRYRYQAPDEEEKLQ